jgi:hypothetical protein
MEVGLDEMIKNAKIRASVLSGLDNRYGATAATAAYVASSGGTKLPISASLLHKRKKGSDSAECVARTPGSSSAGGDSKDKMVAQLQDLIHDRSDKIRNKLTEQLVGKSLVLENNKPTKSRAMRLKR